MTAKPGSQFTIRAMAAADMAIVSEIDQLSFALPWPEKAFHFELFENHNSWLWVAETRNADGDPEVIGVIVMWLIIDEVHISTLAVHPAYRRRGVAQALLEQALKESRQLKALTATLEVRASNQAAQGLYRKFGFEIVGRRRRYYQDDQEDALVMTLKQIPSPPASQPGDRPDNNRLYQP